MGGDRVSQSQPEPVVFGVVIEGIEKALGARLTAEDRAFMKQRGVDLAHVVPAYPLRDFLGLVEALAARLLPDVPEDERYRRLGAEFVKGYTRTAIGLALGSLMKVLGTKRSMLRMGKNFRTTGNYAQVEVHERGPTQVEIVDGVEEAILPLMPVDKHHVIVGYRQGILEQLLVELGVVGAVEIVDRVPARCQVTFRVSWRA